MLDSACGNTTSRAARRQPILVFVSWHRYVYSTARHGRARLIHDHLPCILDRPYNRLGSACHSRRPSSRTILCDWYVPFRLSYQDSTYLICLTILLLVDFGLWHPCDLFFLSVDSIMYFGNRLLPIGLCFSRCPRNAGNRGGIHSATFGQNRWLVETLQKDHLHQSLVIHV
jgi:hypothetical protein